MDHSRHDAPDHAVKALGDLQRLIVRVLRDQPDAAFSKPQAFYRELAVDCGNDNSAILGFEGTIHDEKVAVMDAGSPHRMTGNSGEKGRRGMFDQMRIEIQPLVDVIVRRGGEARGNPAGKKRQVHRYSPVGSTLDADHA